MSILKGQTSSKNTITKIKILFFLAHNLCGLTVANERTNHSDVVNIAGLLAIHGQSQNQASPCGSFRVGAFEELIAMLFAISKVNEDETLLPGIKLKVQIEDTCGSMELATKKALNYTIINYQSKHECVGGHSSQDKAILAIVGERSSDISRAVVNLVGLFHIPVISYAATSPSLSGVKYFARTISPDTFVTQALVDLFQRFPWNYIILLYSDTEFGHFAAKSFRERLSRRVKHVCIAVDERINEDTVEDIGTWKKIHTERLKTKVVVVFATFEDFSRFLQTGKAKYDLEKYIWLSNHIWNGHIADLTCMLKHAISVIPHQNYSEEFAKFFTNARKNLDYLKQYATFDVWWFDEYKSFAEADDVLSNSFSSKCVEWDSSEVSYIIDAVYTIAWALHDILKCDNATQTCNKSGTKNLLKRDVLQAIKNVNFQNEWTQNHILFTQYGNPRNVKFTIASFRHKHQCFVDIGYWYCEVDADNETCTGSLTLTNELEAVDTFLGVCGPPCTPGQHKILDKNYPSCCWKCGNCTHNKYSTKPGSSTCQSCGQDQWPTDNHTACVTVKPEMFLLTKDPTGIILLCVNVISIVVLIAFTVLMVKYSQSKMKIFSGRLLCYLLLFGILMCNTVSIFVLIKTVVYS